MYIPRARVSKKFNYLDHRTYGNCRTSRKHDQNAEPIKSINASEIKVHNNVYSSEFESEQKKLLTYSTRINAFSSSQNTYKTSWTSCQKQLEQAQKKLEELLANNVEVTQSTERKYEQFYTEMGKIEKILQQKTLIEKRYQDQYHKLCENIDNIKYQLEQREKFIDQLSKDAQTLKQCQQLRDQMIQKMQRQRNQTEYQKQQQKYDQLTKRQQRLDQIEDSSISIQTDFQHNFQEDTICQESCSRVFYSQEYKQTLRKAIEQQNVYYQLKTELYEVRNQLGLVKNEFNAYRITKQIEDVQ